MLVIKSKSSDDTKKIAAGFAKTIAPGSTVILAGELGAGKTVFAKGFATGLGIDEDEVLSPTFVLYRSYDGKDIKLNHCDLYRLNDLAEAFEAGIIELVGQKDAVLLIEWADVIAEYIPQKHYVVAIERGEGDNERTIVLNYKETTG